MIKNIIEAICKFLNGHRCLGVFVLLALNYYQIKKIATSLNSAYCPSKTKAERQYAASPSQVETTTMPGDVFNTTSTALESAEFCLDEHIEYQGKLNISFNHLPLSFEEIAKREGPDETGLFEPKTCTPPKNSRVAIIIPFRDETKALIRTRHLQYLLEHMISVLKRQQLHFRFYIINQISGSPFNRAKLLNVGYKEAIKDDPTMDCFVFHDVDLVLEDDRCLYSCDGNPNHYSVAIDKFRYRIPYKKIFGGIVQLDRKMFKAVNGFSNEFWGWGGEDDDMYRRVVMGENFKIHRKPPEFARYKMIEHKRDSGNRKNLERRPMVNRWNFKALIEKRFWQLDGLNSLEYNVVAKEVNHCFVNVTVDLLYDIRMTPEELLLNELPEIDPKKRVVSI
ncbi:Oidioi.mRNA.OKI2018_I69.PAR.g11501.t1.cds [Oikopleura dioica]|uniref:Beta-1,4-galactosyltransferase n=1 Tax=Oikopleura dioica TaxID=34765 RepID=A0ABN7S2P3_OIKDI|nr:Oidioi.mRNA.OKI2018_I69.PAR.g11501.t1.cds [Oikopleura dioica]